MLTDSHAHLDDFPGNELLSGLIARAAAAGVGRIVAIGGNAAANARAVEAAERHPDGVRAAVGYDRDQADRAPELAAVRALTARPAVVAIGETGLDYHYHPGTAAAQRTLFAEMAALAAERRRPLVVHSREADADTLAVLGEYARNWKAGADRLGVLHCCTGSVEFVRAVLDLGLYVSFSGIITFRNAEALRGVARTVPDDRLLIETDTPYLAPVPLRGRPNEPALLPHTAAVLAAVRGTAPEALAELTTRNAARLFDWPLVGGDMG